MPQRPLRIVLSKVGLDGHDRGIKVVARALKDAGFEVIYTGLHRTPEEVVEAAIQEDADLIGVSMLSAAHMTIFPRMISLLRSRGAQHIGVFGGGIIPPSDLAILRKKGVLGSFGPGTALADIVAWCRAYRPAKHGQAAVAPTVTLPSESPAAAPPPAPDRHHGPASPRKSAKKAKRR